MPLPDYARVYRSNSVLTASPAQLVLMLYDGALKALDAGLAGFERPETDLRRIESINAALLKAQAIIQELRGNLDHAAGGEVARSLDQLYDYYIRRLTEANIHKDVQRVTEVRRLVQELRDGWSEMLSKGEPSAGVLGKA